MRNPLSEHGENEPTSITSSYSMTAKVRLSETSVYSFVLVY
jgi:hypothetical protein